MISSIYYCKRCSTEFHGPRSYLGHFDWQTPEGEPVKCRSMSELVNEGWTIRRDDAMWLRPEVEERGLRNGTLKLQVKPPDVFAKQDKIFSEWDWDRHQRLVKGMPTFAIPEVALSE